MFWLEKIQNKSLKLESLLRREPQKTDQADVELSFEIREDKYTVKRSIKRNKGTFEAELRKNGILIESPSSRKVTDELEKILKMDFDLFSRAIYSEQNNLDYFLNLRAGDRKKKLDELLNLNKFSIARKTGVTLLNKLKTSREIILDNLARIKLDKTAFNLLELTEEIKNLNEKSIYFSEKLNKTAELRKIVKTELDALQNKKKNFIKFTERNNQLKGELRRIKSLIDSESKKGNISMDEINSEKLQNLLENLKTKLVDLRTKKELFISTEKEILKLETLLKHTQNELNEFEKNKEKFDDFYKIAEELDLKEKEQITLKTKCDKNESIISELKEHITHLKENENCPLCLSALTPERKEQVLNEKNILISTLIKENEQSRITLSELQQTISKLRNRKDDLLQFKTVKNKISQKKSEIQELVKTLEKITRSFEELKKIVPTTNETELISIKRVVEFRLNELDLVDKLNFIDSKLRELNYDEIILQKKTEEKFNLEKEFEVFNSKKNSLTTLLIEKKRYLGLIKEKETRIKDLESKSILYLKKIEFMSKFITSLEITQTALRILFVDTVNQVMQDLWEKIYPYQDYTSIKLEVDKDYVLKLKNSVGDWISVEAEVSGGERHSAALVLRIAFSLILAPTLKLLILDEPTHNLDVTAITNLAETLRTRVSNLIDQIFIVTHEERLESAVTGNLYRFNKKETETTLTKVTKVEFD